MYSVDTPNQLPPAQGLYHPANEHDACGIGFVVNIKGEPSHDIVLKGLQILENLVHRGACGCDPETAMAPDFSSRSHINFLPAKLFRWAFRSPTPASMELPCVFCRWTGSSG